MLVRDVNLFVILFIAVAVCLPSGAMATITCSNGVTETELDVALLQIPATGGECILYSDTESTLTAGNTTYFDKPLIISSQGYKILLNNTLEFNGTGIAPGSNVIFNRSAWIVNTTSTLWTGVYLNKSLINVIGTSQIISSNISTLQMYSFPDAGINISGTSNTLTGSWNISGTGSPAMAFNLSGTIGLNNLNMNVGNITMSDGGKGINLIGDSNTISFNSANISAPNGKVNLSYTADLNTLTDVGFATPLANIYNGTSYKNVSAWYFYNSSWSPSFKNMNVTINVSQLFPISGNVTISANWSNVNRTYGKKTTQFWNTSLSTDSVGNAGGLIWNLTEYTIFDNFPATVEVNMTFGNNYFNTKYQEYTLPSVVVLNFNPVNSIPTTRFNKTYTTNWSTIPDFTAAQNVQFVVNATTGYTLQANLTFTENLDLTSQVTGNALASLGNNLTMTDTSINLSVFGNPYLNLTALNKTAILTVYPLTTYTSIDQIKITATTDNYAGGGVSTVLFNGANGGWLDRAGFVAGGNTVTVGTNCIVGTGCIRLPVVHFSKYDFGDYTPAPAPYSDSSGGGGDSGPAAVQQSVVQSVVPGASSTVAVNVGGNSAITTVAVTGTGISNLIVTALPQSSLPASITPPTTTVYQYMDVVPARYTTISSVTFNFDVPTTWLADKGYTKNDITLMLWDPAAKTWSSIPTAIIGEKQGTITYQSIAPHMSEFAIAYKKGAAAQAQASVTAIQTSVVLMSTTTTVMTTNTPGVRPTTPTPTQTIAPAPVTPPTGGIPLTTMVMAVVGIIVIVAGAFLVRRWLIRRQNPALFKELE